ncbi:putative RTA1 domain protein [Hypoxylon sp. FL1284]|nr:putative RTA1 domain protein [Hypoxylon sp. FL1284]
MSDGQPVPGSLYIYEPNKIAPIIFAVAYASSAVGHLWQCYHYKCFKILGLHPVCAVLFTVGYALREYGAFNYIYIGKQNMPNLIMYIMSQVFIFICPPLLELANYHVLGRIFRYVPYFPPLPPGKVLAVFGGLMSVVEAMNSLGVSLSANPSSSRSTQDLGSQLTIAALAIQFAIIISCFVLAGIFHWRCHRAGIRSRAVSAPLNTLYVSMFLIMVRCIYRFVEHLGNTAVYLGDVESLKTLSPILRYEWYFYIFEATLMLLNSVLWNVWNPGRYLPRNYHVYLDRDGVTEIEGEAKPDNRSFLAKVACTLTFGLLFRQKDDGAEKKPDNRPFLAKVVCVLSFGILCRNKDDAGSYWELKSVTRRY